ncbi:hypothetical protein PSN45_004088 [Yamadazyma tenuis]|uniref:HPP transmembrane region domain-containing protein n=1 Tax=Candida tenuis (strain ATCC 10573 / BCRC 21748 / CBS 615 / JCM 9827 / NBRC 10315 / NRRL Y-1498 / VKM Y-70) TaxID=590646 RepID=G3B4I6_CANTC|nr:uncharacterized protein CANTEDRAFT_97874 [Yamadazyma tenuis ATCC 10573]EGV63839.1 hypothetical protein CANTEDRAFT_97874 [Yamadazyma tenuis ATCC 10573]WEJ96549.1 hypothetical protein PSN45_004088 [Yamadazyma tenuis]
MVFQFNIDKHTKDFVPPNQVKRLPRALGYFLGNNDNGSKQRPDYFIWLEVLIGSFCGILVLEGVFRNPNIFTDHHNAPIVIASYGATAILCFNTNGLPLAQPRNIILGHFSSALIGVCVEKLFSLSEKGRDHYYIGGALSVGMASVLMSILNCVHPPAGASALLPFIDDGIRDMSWWYLPTHLVSSVLIVAVALITGNVIRKYPAFWWTPLNRTPPPPTQEPKEEKALETLVLNAETLQVPKSLSLSEVEMEVLESLQNKLRDYKPNTDSIGSTDIGQSV